MTDVFASAGVVPNGYAVVDTACLRGCGGDASIDQYVHSRGMTEVIKASDMSFKGINDTAPMKSGGEQEIMVGISGIGCTLRLQRLPQSSTPMLMSIGQLQQMGAVIDLVNHRIDFKTLGVETTIEYSPKGHAMIRIDQWPQNDSASPKMTSTEIDIWSANVLSSGPGNGLGVLPQKVRKQLEKAETAAETTLCGVHSYLTMVRGDSWTVGDPHRVLVTELYCGNGSN